MTRRWLIPVLVLGACSAPAAGAQVAKVYPSDGFEYLAVVGQGVRAREDPGSRSPVVASLTFDVVARRGYVAAAYLRSPIDYRAGLVRESGQWRLALFVAGD